MLLYRVVSPEIPENSTVPPFKYHDEVELDITAITNLGLGIGRVNNWVIMVPFVCIGERVRARIFKIHKNYSEADLLQVLVPSDKRVEPRCPLFGSCGGCQYQHMQYPEQLRLKRSHVHELLLKLGGIDVPVNECLSSEHEYHYRSKITPHFQRFRSEETFSIGFLSYGCRQKITDIPECLIATAGINSVWPKIRQDVLSSARTKKRGGTILLRDTFNGVETNSNACVEQDVGAYKFMFKAGSFFQNNPYLLPKMLDYAAHAGQGCDFLIDAYCGVGTFGIYAAKYFERIYGIEIDDDAIKLARKNAKINDVRNADFVSGDAAKIFVNVPFASENTCILIDPPRAGCGKDFIEQLLTFLPKKIVYISCAPDTQARDIAILKARYKISDVQPVDMFPQTRHIENIVTLDLK